MMNPEETPYKHTLTWMTVGKSPELRVDCHTDGFGRIQLLKDS